MSDTDCTCEERLYAAGDHGTLLERRDGRWRAIATHSNADPRWFDGRLAVGLGGAVIASSHRPGRISRAFVITEQRCSICGHIARRAHAHERARTHDC